MVQDVLNISSAAQSFVDPEIQSLQEAAMGQYPQPAESMMASPCYALASFFP
jgi:hypothetical protein